MLFCWWFLYSCIAVPHDLDSGGAPRSCTLIDALTEAFLLTVLWSDWGIDGQVKVWTRYMDVIKTHCSIIIAIYKWIPLCQHLFTLGTWHPSPANQGYFQGPSRRVDYEVSWACSSQGGGKKDFSWYWSPVSILFLCYNICWVRIVLLLFLHFRACDISMRAEDFRSGPAMIQRLLWRLVFSNILCVFLSEY